MANSGKGKNRRIIVAVIAILLVSAAVLAGIAWQWEQHTRQSERHDYTYETDLSFDTTIEDVTLLLPVPDLNGSPVFADAVVNRIAYGVPPDWNLSIEEENGIPVLAVQAARMVPEYRPTPIPIEPGSSPIPTTLLQGTEYSSETPVLMPVHLAVMVTVNRTIDTRDPRAGEPIFNPDGQFILGTATTPGFRGPVHIHTVPVYVRFTSAQPANLSLRISIQGVNSIWRGGWVSNSYSDTVTLDVRNASQGWLEGEGTLISGEGVYY